MESLMEKLATGLKTLMSTVFESVQPTSSVIVRETGKMFSEEKDADGFIAVEFDGVPPGKFQSNVKLFPLELFTKSID